MAHPIDVSVGKRIRHRRWIVGVTQQELADQVGIRFQQIQKYETGKNRVSASRLWEIASVLGVPVSFFFEGADAGGAASMPCASDCLAKDETSQLVRSYNAIPQAQRQQLLKLAKVLGAAA
ncbi:helix-turn-helix domain-containing protein [Oceaniglobus roseus]|uniref:helix-turn-helix domain-containing protein n=1 Tax=Oceaniglobus roseus TaxID=1737570 RepID=UPI000C7ED768|nr:helix-turn-helix transcriptional regulator [Kandeliimicrobium roseum]